MTVEEFIEELGRYPKDLRVVVSGEWNISKDDFYINDEYYFGDCANPKCKIGEALVICY